MNLRDLNPWAVAPTPETLMAEELPELERLLYLEEKRTDHHTANAQALRLRIAKLQSRLRVPSVTMADVATAATSGREAMLQAAGIGTFTFDGTYPGGSGNVPASDREWSLK